MQTAIIFLEGPPLRRSNCPPPFGSPGYGHDKNRPLFNHRPNRQALGAYSLDLYSKKKISRPTSSL